MRYYVSWQSGRPVLKTGENGMDSAGAALAMHLKVARQRRDDARARLDRRERELRDMESLAAEHGVE